MGCKSIVFALLFSLPLSASTLDECRKGGDTLDKNGEAPKEITDYTVEDPPFEFTAWLSPGGELHVTILSKATNKKAAIFNVDEHIKKMVEAFKTRPKVVDRQLIPAKFFGGRVKSVKITLGGDRPLDDYGRVKTVDPILEAFNMGLAEAKKDREVQDLLAHGKKITDPDVQRKINFYALTRTSLEPIRASALLGEDEIELSNPKLNHDGSYKEVTITIKPSPDRRL